MLAWLDGAVVLILCYAVLCWFAVAASTSLRRPVSMDKGL